MRQHIWILVVCLLIGSALSSCTPSSTGVTDAPGQTPVTTDDQPEPPSEDISGLWVGGFGPIRLFALVIQPEKDGFSGTVRQYLDERDTTIRPLSQQIESLAVDGSSLTLTISASGEKTTLEGIIDGGTVLGTTSGDLEGDFELHRVMNLDNLKIAEWEGVYQLEDDPVAIYATDGAPFAPQAPLWLFNLNTGTMRSLYALSDDELLIGAGVGIAAESEGVVHAERDVDGKITSLLFRRNGQEVIAPRIELRTEDVTFQSGDLTLAGRITLPEGDGPHPAVVIVHGSEPGQRDTYRMLVAMYATQGVAAFAYDKRGVGDSDGLYVEAASTENITNLAGDVAAAAAYLKTRPDIASHLIGLAGGSQAGWVIPQAATLSQDISFVIVVSGPVVSTYEESAWSAYTNDGVMFTGRPLEELEAEIADLDPLGLDSAPFIEQMQIPGIWLFGAVDRSVPARKSAANLEEIKSKINADFTIVYIPNADHLLLSSTVGIERDLPFSNGFSPEYFSSVQDWLARNVILAGP